MGERARENHSSFAIDVMYASTYQPQEKRISKSVCRVCGAGCEVEGLIV